MESLVSFFEALEGGGAGATGGSSGSGGRRPPAPPPLQRPGAPPQQSQQSSPPPEAEQWGEVERFLLGEGWDKAALDEIERELAAAVADAAPAQRAVAGAAASSAASPVPRSGSGVAAELERMEANGEEEREEEEADPWVDDVTTLLLGLVQLSHERYTRGLRPVAAAAGDGGATAAAANAATAAASLLTAPLLPEVAGPDGQDARARAFWAADFPVLAFDDAADARVEYCNRAAAGMLLLRAGGGSPAAPPSAAASLLLTDAEAGEGYLALFGAPAHELLVDPAEWAYALRAAEDSGEAARVPRLAFVRRPLADVVAAAEDGGGGGAPAAASTVVVARDVLVWRVDSLEDTLVGYAVAVRGGWTEE